MNITPLNTFELSIGKNKGKGREKGEKRREETGRKMEEGVRGGEEGREREKMKSVGEKGEWRGQGRVKMVEFQEERTSAG